MVYIKCIPFCLENGGNGSHWEITEVMIVHHDVVRNAFQQN